MSSLPSKGVSEPPPGAIRAAVDRIAASPAFENSDRMIRFLRFIVEKTLAGQQDQLKEYVLGVEVFDRQQGFDPKTDTIVRVEARRLRRKLKEYYDSAGAPDPVRIDVPTPGYTPVFLTGPVPSMSAGGRRRGLMIAPLAVGLLVIGLGIAWWRSGTRAPRIDSIAVLPFVDLSPDKSQEYFCDGFTEELISTLSAINGLRVVARTSAFAFKDKAGDIREIGRKLDAAAVLEGSVRRNGDQLRITAQLIQASNGYHIWSQSFDRDRKDTLGVEEDISRLIADAVRRPFEQVQSTATPKLEAYDLYLLGRYHWSKEEPAEIEKSIGYFEKSIATDPKFPLAYSGLAEAYSYIIDMDYAPTAQILPKARAAADQALALDDSLAEAHTARGLVAHELEWDQARAEKEFLRAVQLKPGYAYGIHWYGHFLEAQGRAQEGRVELNRALAFDPLNPMYLMDLTMNSYKLRHFDAALEDLGRLKAVQPNFPYHDVTEGMIYVAQHDWARAIAAYKRARDLLGAPFVFGLLGQAEALAGQRAEAQAELAQLEKLSHTAYVPASIYSLVYYALGDRGKGYHYMRQAFEERNAVLIWLKHSPMFDGAAQDPRARELMDKAGL